MLEILEISEERILAAVSILYVYNGLTHYMYLDKIMFRIIENIEEYLLSKHTIPLDIKHIYTFF